MLDARCCHHQPRFRFSFHTAPLAASRTRSLLRLCLACCCSFEPVGNLTQYTNATDVAWLGFTAG